MSNQNNSTIFSTFYQAFNQYTIWLKDQVANNKAISLMWKNGFNIDTEDKVLMKFLQKFIRKNKFIQHCHEIERICSMWGVAIATINKTKTGEIKLVIADPYMTNDVGYAFDEEVAAVVYKKIQHTNFTFSIKEIWTATDVTRVGVGADNKEISMMEINAKIPLELQLPEKETHNLGFVPVVMFKNKPNINLFGSNNIVSWITNADDYGCYKLQQDFEHTLCAAGLEVQNNRTRVFANFSPIDFQGFQENPYSNPFLRTQWMKNQQSTGGSAPGAINPLIQTIQGDPKFKAYNERLDWIKKQYYEACGYTYNPEAESSDKTATEISYNSALDNNTTAKKRQVREDDMNRLFRKIIAVAEIGYEYEKMSDEQPFTFMINNAFLANLAPQQALAIFKEKQALGVFSAVEFFQEMHGLSREDAEDKASQVLEDQEKYGSDMKADEESDEDIKAEVSKEEGEE